MALPKRIIDYLAEFAAAVVIAPTNNPTFSLEVSPTVSTAAANARAINSTPVFTGSGGSAAAISSNPKMEPSANVAAVAGSRNTLRLKPPVGVTITLAHAAAYQFTTEAGEGAVTEAISLHAEAPGLITLKPTTIIGVSVGNHGVAGVTTSVGVDVAAQTGSSTNIGVRIAKGNTYSLQLSDTGGTAAGGIEFGTDTNVHRTAAGVVKVENIVDVETGVRIKGAAAAGNYLRGDGTNFVANTIQAADLVSAWAAMTSLGAKVEKVAALQEPEARTESVGAVARLRGGVKVKALETLTAGETVCTLPEGKRPPKLVKIPTIVGTVTAGVLSIATTGVVTLDVNVTTGVEIYFDGIQFNLT